MFYTFFAAEPTILISRSALRNYNSFYTEKQVSMPRTYEAQTSHLMSSLCYIIFSAAFTWKEHINTKKDFTG